MALIVTGIGFLIHVYSVGYMHDDARFPRFFAFLNFFILMMLTLVLANNYLLLYVGWEGVGLASYLLIGFWFEKPSAADAGKKAFLVNRIGDFGLAHRHHVHLDHAWAPCNSARSLRKRPRPGPAPPSPPP